MLSSISNCILLDDVTIKNIEKLKEQQLPIFIDDLTLANQLGIQLKTLWWMISKKSTLYKIKKIPKKGGEDRILHVPDFRLRNVQNMLYDILLSKLPIGEHLGAYTKGKGLKYTIKKHLKKDVLIHLDIKNYYPSIKYFHVRNYFQHLGYSYFVSCLLADLLTVEKGNDKFLPQGSTTSPIVSNLIGDYLFDQNILNWIKKYYTGWL